MVYDFICTVNTTSLQARQHFRQTHAMLTKDADSAMSVAKNETH